MLTEEGKTELLYRVSKRIRESSEIAFICAEYTGNNTLPITPDLIADHIVTCTLRQKDGGKCEIIAPSGEGVRFLIVCTKSITNIINEELEDTISQVQFLYKNSQPEQL